MSETGRLYQATRRRVFGLVEGCSPEELALVVPACPPWTVHDVVAHLAGVTEDALTGNMEGAPGDAWTAAQVERGRGRSTADLLAEWEGRCEVFDTLDLPAPAVLDITSHEQDLRGALGRPGHRTPDDNEALAWALPMVLGLVASRLADAVGGPVEVRAGGEAARAGGDGEPVLELDTTPFELFRAVFGRRSEAQVRSLGWTGDPGDHVRAMLIFPAHPVDLVE